jgi:hypothetical protein
VGLVDVYEWMIDEIENMLRYKKETLAKNELVTEYHSTEQWLEKYNQWAIGEEEGDEDE